MFFKNGAITVACRIQYSTVDTNTHTHTHEKMTDDMTTEGIKIRILEEWKTKH